MAYQIQRNMELRLTPPSKRSSQNFLLTPQFNKNHHGSLWAKSEQEVLSHPLQCQLSNHQWNICLCLWCLTAYELTVQILFFFFNFSWTISPQLLPMVQLKKVSEKEFEHVQSSCFCFMRRPNWLVLTTVRSVINNHSAGVQFKNDLTNTFPNSFKTKQQTFQSQEKNVYSFAVSKTKVKMKRQE